MKFSDCSNTFLTFKKGSERDREKKDNTQRKKKNKKKRKLMYSFPVT